LPAKTILIPKAVLPELKYQQYLLW